MKPQNLILAFLLLPMVANGGDENAISELNAALVPVYGRLLEDGKATDLIGKDLDLTLVLKYASDRYSDYRR